MLVVQYRMCQLYSQDVSVVQYRMCQLYSTGCASCTVQDVSVVQIVVCTLVCRSMRGMQRPRTSSRLVVRRTTGWSTAWKRSDKVSTNHRWLLVSQLPVLPLATVWLVPVFPYHYCHSSYVCACVACSLLVYSLFTPCLLLVYFLFTPCLLLVYSLFTSCSLLVYSLFTSCLLLVYPCPPPTPCAVSCSQSWSPRVQ